MSKDIQVASVAAFNPDGHLLFGIRNDNGKYTLPGGSIEEGEKPTKAAIREMYEEASVKPIELYFLGEDTVVSPRGVNVTVHAYKATVEGTPNGENDPDEECDKWEFVDVKDGLPEKILNNLHSPKNVVLKFLGLLNPIPREEYEVDKPLKKSLDNAMTVGSMLSTKPFDSKLFRQHLWANNNDHEKALLLTHGFEGDGLKAFQSLSNLYKPIHKEPKMLDVLIVKAVFPDGEEVANIIRKCFKDKAVKPVKLGGRHSAGTLFAQDDESGQAWLLKPGSGPNSPAAGVREDPSTQSEREACFWHIANLWGLSDDFPRCDLLELDGQQYACLSYMSKKFHELEDELEEKPAHVFGVLNKYRTRGRLHQWGVIDFVLGNTDRHVNNALMDEATIKLIDHGSAFAGVDFDPAHDKMTFVPFYLRFACPKGVNFNMLTPIEKLKYMPSCPVDNVLKQWVDSLDINALKVMLPKYGIDALPSVERFKKVLEGASALDRHVNRLWVTI
ncbi:Nudix_Hydrolase domain containing protein [uncultured Caudovirales phage]|uniref:Nudix_Hydrolase domain containing protein n=1 Tax=uncultured Caudovirales phage TaxID=2100421 RepID=A0A6J5L3S4_9CAUD|nr:Nudix_Hydrolase domain containing protein [uncultured Caudovirales phage]